MVGGGRKNECYGRPGRQNGLPKKYFKLKNLSVLNKF
jgi:hypothetical protein